MFVSCTVRDKVITLYVCHLLSERKIAARLGIGLGTVSGILKQAKKKMPDLDDLRRLNMSLKNAKASWVEAMRGATMLQRLDTLNIDVEDIPKCTKFLKQYKENAGAYLDAAVRLQQLENETGLTYEELIVEYEEKKESLPQLKTKIENAKRQEEKLNNSIRELEALKEIQDTLDANNISTSILDLFIKRHKQFQEKGFTLDVATVIANELSRFDMTPVQAAKLLAEILSNYSDVRSAVKDLESTQEKLGKDVDRLNTLISSTRDQLYGLNEEKKTLGNTIATYTMELSNIRRKIDESRQEYKEQIEELKKQSEAEHKKLEDALQKRKNEIEQEISKLVAESDSKKRDIETLEQYIDKLGEELNKFEVAIMKNAGIACLVSLMEDPVNAGEQKIVFEALLAVMIGLEAYIKTKWASVQNSLAIE